MGRGRRSCGSSSSMDSSSNPPVLNSSSAWFHKSRTRRDLSTDLGLGLGISTSRRASSSTSTPRELEDAVDCRSARNVIWEEEDGECNDNVPTLYVKVYMEGVPIGRKLDLLARDGYHDLIRTLDQMFDTNILWGADMESDIDEDKCHVLTYEDEEGDWMIVGDVPWEMFLTTAKRLRIASTFPSLAS